MQIMESIIFLVTIALLGFLIKYKSIKKQYVSLLLGITMLSLVLHLILESTRWQFYPLYVAMVISIVMAGFLILRIVEFNKMRITRRVLLTLSFVLVTLSGIANFSFPQYDLPLPSGEFLIGTESFVLTDNERTDVYGEVGFRRIKIQVWYPAETIKGYEQAPWLEDGIVVAQELAKDMNLPSFVLNHTEITLSNSYQGAPISEALENYPVVVISHGWRGFRNLHTDLAEELASKGYIVVGIDHTNGSVATVFSDSDIAYLNLDALPSRESTPDFLEYANKLVDTYSKDITLTLNELEKINTGDVLSRFKGKLDLTNIGLMGHSTGAGADVAVAINDNRIKALIGMDAWVEPVHSSEIEKGLDIPALFLRSGWWETGLNNANLLSLIDNSDGSSWLYQIDGTTHYDFSMVYMYSPLTKYLNITGELDGDYLLLILEDMITNFFDEFLKGDNTSSVNGMEEVWDEVIKIK